MTRTLRAAGARGAAGALLATAALGLAACASDSVDEASGDFCSSLVTLDAEVASLQTLVTGDATLDEIDEQREVVRNAYDDVAANREDLDAAVVDESEQAYDAYQDALAEVPGDSTVSQAAPLYADATAAYLTALDQIAINAGCETS